VSARKRKRDEGRRNDEGGERMDMCVRVRGKKRKKERRNGVLAVLHVGLGREGRNNGLMP
jgi:hypothetical protein